MDYATGVNVVEVVEVVVVMGGGEREWWCSGFGMWCKFPEYYFLNFLIGYVPPSLSRLTVSL